MFFPLNLRVFKTYYVHFLLKNAHQAKRINVHSLSYFSSLTSQNSLLKENN